MDQVIDIKPLLKERYAGANKQPSKTRFGKLKTYLKPKSDSRRKPKDNGIKY